MWELSKDYFVAAKTDRGYRTTGLQPDYGKVRETVMRAVKEKQHQMLSQIETFSPERWKGPGSLTFKRGCGEFVSREKVKVLCEGRDDTFIRADHFLVATGSKPRSFAEIALDHKRILSSDSILNLKEFPGRLVIIGAGIVGCEYATIFSNFNRTKVSLVDYEETVIPYEDEDISMFVSSCLEKNGVEIFHSASLREIVKHSKHLDVVLDFKDGHSEVMEADAVLISIGRVPDLSCLRLERIGIIPDADGRIETDENCRAYENIYAAGDVTHLPALVNIAEMEARHAVMSMFGRETKPLSYRDISTIMFFQPEVVAVGMNEKSCRKKKISYRAAFYSNALVARAIAMRAGNGFVKMIATDEEKPRLLGMRAAGPQASSTVMAVALFMQQSASLHEMLNTLYPHPTMSEAIQECVRMFLNKSVYKPAAFPEELKIWSWKP
jgi:dihydrolipoamide dehydrogenase